MYMHGTNVQYLVAFYTSYEKQSPNVKVKISNDEIVSISLIFHQREDKPRTFYIWMSALYTVVRGIAWRGKFCSLYFLSL